MLTIWGWRHTGARESHADANTHVEHIQKNHISARALCSARFLRWRMSLHAKHMAGHYRRLLQEDSCGEMSSTMEQDTITDWQRRRQCFIQAQLPACMRSVCLSLSSNRVETFQHEGRNTCQTIVTLIISGMSNVRIWEDYVLFVSQIDFPNFAFTKPHFGQTQTHQMQLVFFEMCLWEQCWTFLEPNNSDHWQNYGRKTSNLQQLACFFKRHSVWIMWIYYFCLWFKVVKVNNRVSLVTVCCRVRRDPSIPFTASANQLLPPLVAYLWPPDWVLTS